MITRQMPIKASRLMLQKILDLRDERNPCKTYRMCRISNDKARVIKPNFTKRREFSMMHLIYCHTDLESRPPTTLD